MPGMVRPIEAARAMPSALLAAVLLTGACAGEAPVFRDLAGAVVDPWPGTGHAVTVWVFVTTDCPISNAYAPEIAAIERDLRARGGRLIVVHTDASRSHEQRAEHARAYGLGGPVIADPSGALVRHAGASVTPEAAVFDADGVLRYRGRIDDRYRDLGTRRPEPTTRDLRVAIDAVVRGDPVGTPRTDAVGCVIEGASG